MTNDLELRLEGDIVTTGGLLIVDPHWIHDLDNSLKGLKDTNRTCKEQPPSITENTQNAMRKIQALQEQLSGELLEVKDERIVIELMRQYIALQEQEKKRARAGELQEGPFRAPPFLSRGNGYLTFWLHDKRCTPAVVQKENDLSIYVFHPIYRSKDKEFHYIDVSTAADHRVDGDVLGWCGNDRELPRQFVIVDPNRVGIKPETPRQDHYVLAKTEAGVYTCKFADENRMFSIQKRS